jgi:hypothetical protein
VIATDRIPNCDAGEDRLISVLKKGKETYVFCFDESQRAEVIRRIGSFAANPELSFDWYDAATLAQQIRQSGQSTVVSG